MSRIPPVSGCAKTHIVTGIAIGSNSGVVNIYDRHALILPSADDELNVKERPEPSKTFMQLTVPVTTILFSPDGQLACFASVHKKDALRLVHTGSLSVYRNWPTEQTPLVGLSFPHRFGNFPARAHNYVGPGHFGGILEGHAARGRQRCRRCQIVGDTGLNSRIQPPFGHFAAPAPQYFSPSHLFLLVLCCSLPRDSEVPCDS